VGILVKVDGALLNLQVAISMATAISHKSFNELNLVITTNTEKKESCIQEN
jgi:hypothetical protein